MTEPQQLPNDSPQGARRGRKHHRREGWHSAEILRTAALVMGLYVAARLFWMANPLFFTAFLGTLFGLAVASGTDRLERLKIPRGIGAALIVLTFFGLLFGFGAWMAPTIRTQAAEIRQRLPDALARASSWARTHQSGMVGMVVDGVLNGDSTAAKPD